MGTLNATGMAGIRDALLAEYEQRVREWVAIRQAVGRDPRAPDPYGDNLRATVHSLKNGEAVQVPAEHLADAQLDAGFPVTVNRYDRHDFRVTGDGTYEEA